MRHISASDFGHVRSKGEEAPVAAVERALRILAAFRIDDDTLSLGELADRTGLNKATILRLASTLLSFGYLSRISSGEFRIGATPLALGTMYQRSTQPAERILPSLERLVAETGESAAFFIQLSDDKRVCLYRVDSRHAVREHVRVGDVGPIGRGAAGIVLARFRSRSDARNGDFVIVTEGEVTPEVRAAAAPAFDGSGRVAGAISVSGPKFRFSQAACEAARPFLRAAARDATLHIGGDATIFDVRPKHARKRSAACNLIA